MDFISEELQEPRTYLQAVFDLWMMDGAEEEDDHGVGLHRAGMEVCLLYRP